MLEQEGVLVGLAGQGRLEQELKPEMQASKNGIGFHELIFIFKDRLVQIIILKLEIQE